jgi:ribosome-binding protein aMBF1 (putative translation factor)
MTDREDRPAFPGPNVDGYYPATETVQVVIAREIIERRRKAGWSQAKLAQQAGVREETVKRLESGQYPTAVKTVEKIDQALTNAGV